MENSAGIQASLAGRYASALFDLASEAKAKKDGVSAVEADLEKLRAALTESGDLQNLISNPQISRAQAAQAIAAVGKQLKVSGLTQNFLAVLAGNRRLGDLPGMIRAFNTIAAAQRGEVTATVTSAHPLSDSQLDTLRAKLTQREGRTVKISADVDPELLGGMVVTIGSQRIDGSIRTRLNSLAQAMKG